MTLIEFLLARIAEDEYEANVCLDQYRRGDGGSTPRWTRQLAECEAKRRIIEAHPLGNYFVVPDDFTLDEYMSTVCHRCVDWWQQEAVPACPTLRALALPYADHPDYRAEWTHAVRE